MFMIVKLFIEILKEQMYFLLNKEWLRLVILELPEFYHIHYRKQELWSVLRIIFRQKFVKKNLIIRSLISGLWDVPLLR
jgi:hypothetical protein